MVGVLTRGWSGWLWLVTSETTHCQPAKVRLWQAAARKWKLYWEIFEEEKQLSNVELFSLEGALQKKSALIMDVITSMHLIWRISLLVTARPVFHKSANIRTSWTCVVRDGPSYQLYSFFFTLFKKVVDPPPPFKHLVEIFGWGDQSAVFGTARRPHRYTALMNLFECLDLISASDFPVGINH